jgi:hypothetical protein
MKVTNNLHLPEAFVKAVSVERHNKAGSYSATTLNKGTKEVILQERHWDEFSVDAADQVWATFGTAVHAIMEKYEDGNFHEEKFDIAVSKSRVTGVVDSYDMEHGVINDWKTASVYKVMHGDFSDWYKQGMTYAWLLKQNGLDVRHCRFIALLKDHSKSKAKTDASYPQSPVFTYEFDVTPEELQQTTPPALAVVSVGSGGRNRLSPLCLRTKRLISSSGTAAPAITVSPPLPLFRPFIFSRFMIMPPRGTAPPPTPVRDPCTVTGMARSLQYRRISAASSAVFGKAMLSA